MKRKNVFEPTVEVKLICIIISSILKFNIMSETRVCKVCIVLLLSKRLY